MKCNIADCPEPVRAKRLCQLHYNRWIRTGRADVGPSARLNEPAKGRTCTADQCDEPVRCKGLCARHYDRAVKRRGACGSCGGPCGSKAVLCSVCHDAQWLERPQEKKCAGCERTLPLDSFGWRTDGRGRSKVRSRCRSCDSSAAVAAARTPAGKARAIIAKKVSDARVRSDPQRWFWRSIRMSCRQLRLDWTLVEERVLRVGNTCEACGWSGPIGYGLPRVALDHDHATGQFRGLLCGPCNAAAGWAEHHSALAVAAYLARGKV